MKDRKNYTFVTGLKRLVIAGLVAAMVTTSTESVWGDGVVTASAATAKVKIDKKAFPDSKFRLYVKYYFDTNSDGYLSKKERNNAELISAKSWKISSFKGIKYFPNLKYLDCGYPQLSKLVIHSSCISYTLFRKKIVQTHHLKP